MIRLTYGYTGNGEAWLVTSTAHEEGAGERFDYYPAQKLTVYTNHSGVATRYYYDDSHRTVREEHSDGTVRTYTYNGSGQKAGETANGFTIVYGYDGRGNISQKSYGDGKSESYAWNDNDQMTRYADRDGVIMKTRHA